METVYVECSRDGTVIRTYDFGYARAPGLALPTHEHLIEQTKSNRTSERLAFPPYDGITFRVLW